MTDYVLKAGMFRQIVERRPDGSALRVVKHRKGAVISDLTEVDVERLLAAGAIAPVPEFDEGDDQGDDDTGTGSPDDESPAGDTGDQGDDGTPDSAGEATSVAKPSRTGLVADWRAYAISRGLTEAEAADLTRAELIAQFGD